MQLFHTSLIVGLLVSLIPSALCFSVQCSRFRKSPTVLSSSTHHDPSDSVKQSGGLTELHSTLPKKKILSKQHGSHGILSPAVEAAKMILGDEKLNEFRGRIISIHSDVIGKFVDTYDSPIGRFIVAKLFELVDSNKNGTLEKHEIADVVQVLGFSWLEEKQIEGIIKRADSNGNGTIEFEEFMMEIPRTLRTNLIKLAKKNGGELGLLA